MEINTETQLVEAIAGAMRTRDDGALEKAREVVVDWALLEDERSAWLALIDAADVLVLDAVEAAEKEAVK